MTRKEAINLYKDFKFLPREPKYCDRNICLKNEYNGIGCNECEVTKSQEPCGDMVSRGVFEQVKWERDVAIEQLKELGYGLGQKIEPCEDCVSRSDARNCITFHEVRYKMLEDFDKLPSVQPKPKTGHWEQYGYSWEDKFKCSECGKEQPKILCGERIIGHWSDYCPYCGAKMVEPQGSE